MYVEVNKMENTRAFDGIHHTYVDRFAMYSRIKKYVGTLLDQKTVIEHNCTLFS